MRVLLVRHSEAASGEGIEDAARPLTTRGSELARRVAQTLLAQALGPTCFVTSPRLRAQQTAEIFAEVCGYSGAIQTLPSLSYTVAASQAAADLERLPGTVFAFGHMPTIAEIASLLCRGRSVGAFAPSEALWIENGRTLWSLDPDNLKILRR